MGIRFRVEGEFEVYIEERLSRVGIKNWVAASHWSKKKRQRSNYFPSLCIQVLPAFSDFFSGSCGFVWISRNVLSFVKALQILDPQTILTRVTRVESLQVLKPVRTHVW